jgi:hypothetical protein
LPCLDPGTAGDVEVIMKGIFSISGTLHPMEAHKNLSQQRTLTRPNSVVVRKNILIITQQMDLLVGANEYDVDDLFSAALCRVWLDI